MENVYLFLDIFIVLSVIIYFFHYDSFSNILKKVIITITNFKDKKSWGKCKKVYIDIPNIINNNNQSNNNSIDNKNIGNNNNLNNSNKDNNSNNNNSYNNNSILNNAQDLEKILAPQLIELFKTINSGSIFLIQNNTDTVSMIMRVGLNGRFSHCSILLQPEYLNNNKEPLMFQAAGEKIDSKNTGPDIHYFTKFLSEYMCRYPNCRYVIRNLKTPLNPIQASNLFNFVHTTIKKKDYRFCTNFELFWSYTTEKYFRFLIPFVHIEKEKLTFCSKIVTETYQFIGLLGKRNVFSTNPNDFTLSNCDIFSEEIEIIFKM